MCEMFFDLPVFNFTITTLPHHLITSLTHFNIYTSPIIPIFHFSITLDIRLPYFFKKLEYISLDLNRWCQFEYKEQYF